MSAYCMLCDDEFKIGDSISHHFLTCHLAFMHEIPQFKETLKILWLLVRETADEGH